MQNAPHTYLRTHIEKKNMNWYMSDKQIPFSVLCVRCWIFIMRATLEKSPGKYKNRNKWLSIEANINIAFSVLMETPEKAVCYRNKILESHTS